MPKMTADEVLANLPIRECDRQQGLYAEEEAAIREAFAVLEECEAIVELAKHESDLYRHTSKTLKAARARLEEKPDDR